jgi:hypothetical protein
MRAGRARMRTKQPGIGGTPAEDSGTRSVTCPRGRGSASAVMARLASSSTGPGYSRAAGPRCHAAVHLAQYRLSAGWPGGSGVPQLAHWPGTVRVASSSTGTGCFRAAAPRQYAAVHFAQYRLSARWPGGSGAPQLAQWPGSVMGGSSGLRRTRSRLRASLIRAPTLPRARRRCYFRIADFWQDPAAST